MNKLKINNNPFLLGMRVFGKASTIASASLISEKSSHSTPCKTCIVNYIKTQTS